jgi:hypothetical protein
VARGSLFVAENMGIVAATVNVTGQQVSETFPVEIVSGEGRDWRRSDKRDATRRPYQEIGGGDIFRPKTR